MTDVDAVDAEPGVRTAFRTCPLCEAGCGLEISLKGDAVQRIRGDMQDVFSHGYLCPKGSTLKQFAEDPDRLRRPVVKRDGVFVEVDWDEAFAVVEARLLPIQAEFGRDAVAIYMGNPGAHNMGPMLFNRNLIQALGTKNRFSASTVDQRPKELSASLMFGSVTVPVPDLDRTDFLLMLGANPHASNGSLCTAPDFPGRLDGLQERGGTLVVVDPRRSETAERADQHIAIRPGTDAHFLAAICQVLIADGLAVPLTIADLASADADRAAAAGVGRARTSDIAAHCDGLEGLPALLAPYTPEAVAPICGVSAATIRGLAHALAAAPTAAAYGRIGTCTQEFGTLASWLVDVVNILSGNLDQVGGAMFSKGATGQSSSKGKPATGRGFSSGRFVSRVSGMPEMLGEFPVTAMVEEMETPGGGQVRALITVAGNPVASNPNADRMAAAIAGLDFFVSIDPYINETSTLADVILPPPNPLQKSHYDLALLNFAVRNVANYSAPVVALDAGQPDEWEILLRLAGIAAGMGAHADVDAFVRDGARSMLASAVKDSYGLVYQRDVAELDAMLGDRRGPERLLDVMLRTGPYGDGFGSVPDGLTLAVLEANPHGVDLGPLQPNRVPDLLRTATGRIDVVPELIASDLPRLAASLERDWDSSMVLVGRRHVRSNNSWMHNIRVLTKGRNRCTMQIHPDDAARLAIADGAPARVTSRVGELVVTAEHTDGIRPGVISIPHGFGQNTPGVRLAVASEYRGVNTNVLTDEYFRDALSGNIALNGVPVTVGPA